MLRHCSPIVLIALLALSGCEKDKPKVEDKKPESTPVPSGMVFNDFLPTTGSAAGLGVRDAGLEGGLAAVAGGGEPGASEQGEPSDAAGGKVAIKVVEPGAEPRALRKYTFVPNKVDKRVLTVTQSMTQNAGGQSAPPQEVTLKLSVDITTKQVKPTAATLEIKVTKIDLPGAPPQVAPMLASMNGLSGTFEVAPNGDVGEVQFSGTPQMQNQLAETVLGTMSQAVQLLLAPLPTAPVGVGAKWEMVAKSEAEQNVRRFTLKEVSNEGALVESEVEMKAPRRMQQNPRGGPPATVEGDGKGKYTQSVRFNQVVVKGEGDQTLTQKIELNDPRGGGKQTATVIQKTHDVIETPGAK